MTEISKGENQAINDTDQTVLVAVDFSEDSRAALLWACRYTESAKARLVVLHVIHDLASNPGFYRTEDQDEMRPMRSVAESMMDEFLAETLKDNPSQLVLTTIETRLVEGLPPGRIVEVAELLKASLVVVGSRGMTGLPHLILGSVAEQVVELVSLPVVIVKSPEFRNKESSKKEKKQKKEEKKKRKEEKKRMKLALKQSGNTNG